jgi:hypothetical protein
MAGRMIRPGARLDQAALELEGFATFTRALKGLCANLPSQESALARPEDLPVADVRVLANVTSQLDEDHGKPSLRPSDQGWRCWGQPLGAGKAGEWARVIKRERGEGHITHFLHLDSARLR